MTRRFTPCFDILPPAQRRLWPELQNAPALGLTLYGGTAIALRLGHRDSVDFDFFTEQALDHSAIKAAFPFVAGSTTRKEEPNTWVLSVPYADSKHSVVQVAFLGLIGFGRVGEPELTEDGILRVASLDDLMATKVKVILQRAEAKDYRDIAAMIRAGVSLSRGLAAARLFFGPHFQPSESLKALVYFGDGDLDTLTITDRNTLVEAVSAVRDLPEITLRSRSLAGKT